MLSTTKLEGWRRLNSGSGIDSWEVRLLDDASAAQWAPPVAALWAAGRPDGATRHRHHSELLRAYLLATHGGVWVDLSLLPMAPLDIPLHHHRHLLRDHRGAEGSRSGLGRGFFFAYSFPDPTLSLNVALLPHADKLDIGGGGGGGGRGGGGGLSSTGLTYRSLNVTELDQLSIQFETGVPGPL